MAIVKLGLMPLWNPNTIPGTHTALFIQAYHSAALVQKVTISGPGISGSIVAQSAPGTPNGTVFLSKEINMGPHAPQATPLIYTVDFKYIDGGKECDPSVLAVQGTPLGPKCIAAFAFSNDLNSPPADADYNDAVVSLSLFPHSRD